MEKRIYNEHTGISYTLQGEYYLPDLELPEQEDKPIGLWGQQHLRYIKQHRKILYINLITSGKLNEHLADIDEQADNMFSRLVNQINKNNGRDFPCRYIYVRKYYFLRWNFGHDGNLVCRYIILFLCF